MYSILMYCIFGGACIGGLLTGAYIAYQVMLAKRLMPAKETLEKALKLAAETQKIELALAEKTQEFKDVCSDTSARIEKARKADELLYGFDLRENGINQDYQELLKRNTDLQEQNRVLEMAIKAAEGITNRRR